MKNGFISVLALLGGLMFGCMVALAAPQLQIKSLPDVLLKKLPQDVQSSITRAQDNLESINKSITKAQTLLNTTKNDLQKTKSDINITKKTLAAAITAAQQQVEAAKKLFEQKVAEALATLNQKSQTALQQVSEAKSTSREAEFAAKNAIDAANTLRQQVSSTILMPDERSNVDQFLTELDTQTYNTQKANLAFVQAQQDVELEIKTTN